MNDLAVGEWRCGCGATWFRITNASPFLSASPKCPTCGDSAEICPPPAEDTP